MMRIALFTETFLPKIDGVVNTLCSLLEYLAQQGHESILFAPEGAPVSYAATRIYPLPAVPLPFYPELKLASPLVEITEQLTAFRPDVVHLLNPLAVVGAGMAGLNQAQVLGIPTVASFHTDIAGFAEQWGLGFLDEAIWALLRWTYNRADLTLAPSFATLYELERRGFEHLDVWTRGVDSARFHPAHFSKEWRWRLSDGNPDAPLLLYVGRTSTEKRIDWLRPLMDALPGARLAIVGDGPARDDLERLFAGTATVFTGYLHGGDLACAYASADVFVFPSHKETLGNVVLEAMASGLPVVAAGSGGPLDLVADGKNGLLFEPTDPDDLIRCVRWLLQHPDSAHRLGVEARRTAEHREWNYVHDQLLAHYQRVCLPTEVSFQTYSYPDKVLR
jgi:glycosyltransferase involved in cell wall biosynthesis